MKNLSSLGRIAVQLVRHDMEQAMAPGPRADGKQAFSRDEIRQMIKQKATRNGEAAGVDIARVIPGVNMAMAVMNENSLVPKDGFRAVALPVFSFGATLVSGIPFLANAAVQLGSAAADGSQSLGWSILEKEYEAGNVSDGEMVELIAGKRGIRPYSAEEMARLNRLSSYGAGGAG